MLKQIALIGAMLLGLAVSAAGAAEGAGAADGTNLLPDITDTQRWLLMNPSNEADCRISSEEGAARVDITKLRSEPARSDMSLGCMGVAGKAGKAYTLRFAAKASEPRQITISAIEPGKRGESIIGQAATELKSSWQTYVCRIVLTRDCTPKTRLPSFEFGDKTGTIWFRNVTLVPADGGAAAAVPAPAPATPARNLLPNATAPDQWMVGQKGSAKGTVDQQDNHLRIYVSSAGADRWSYRIQHQGISATAGQSLTLKLSARASSPRKITISSQQAQPPMGDLADEVSLDLNTEWQEFTCKFTFAKGTTPPNDLFPIVELGDQIGTVWLRDISLTGGETQAEARTETRTEATSAAPSHPNTPKAGAKDGTPHTAGPAEPVAVNSIPDMTKEGTWRFAPRAGSGSAHKEDNALTMTFTRNGGANAPESELRYTHLEYGVGKKYRLKFSAKAESAVQVKLVVQNDIAPYQEEFSAPIPIALTPEWHDVDMKLELTKPTTDTMFSIGFLLGDKPNAISFRNMSLVPE